MHLRAYYLVLYSATVARKWLVNRCFYCITTPYGAKTTPASYIQFCHNIRPLPEVAKYGYNEAKVQAYTRE